jgi:hypothetical protein
MGWTVDGNFGNGLLNLVNNNYNEDWANPGMLHFYAQDGNQSIDLTGTGDQGDNGISQTVSTVAGQRYLLTFYVGHADDHYIVSYSGPTTVGLKINGIEVGTFVNNADTLNQINWTQNSYDFLANSNITTISFYTRNTNNYAGLDNVSLEPNPEPGTFWMMGGAVFLSVLLTRKVRRSGVS